MSFEQQKNIFLKTVNHIRDLNELLNYNNCTVDKKIIATNLDKNVFNLNTDDMNLYLSSLLIYVFTNKKEIIKINKNDASKIITINFVNTVLEELNVMQVEYEVL